jgi:hypothetical protein
MTSSATNTASDGTNADTNNFRGSSCDHGTFAQDRPRNLGQIFKITRGLAEQAIRQFENSPRTNFANQLQTKATPAVATKGKDYG